METINIKFDKEQLEELVKKVTENIIKKAKEAKEETKTESKLIRLYLEANETDSESEKEKIYYGYLYNTLSKEYASQFNLYDEFDKHEVIKLKKQGWKEEVVYK